MIGETKYYELSYLANPQLAPEDAARIDEELRGMLGAYQATLDSWDSPKRKPLSYAIQRETEAHAGALRFTCAREYATAIESTMKKNKNIMRFMLLEWKKTPPRRVPRIQKTEKPKEEYVPTDEKALDEKLEEIFGETITTGEQPNESRTKSENEIQQT